METVGSITLVAIFVASVFLLIWLYRPNSSKLYDTYSKMALKDDRKIKKDKPGGKRPKKKNKSQ